MNTQRPTSRQACVELHDVVPDAHTLNTLRHIESTDVQQAMTALSGWTLDTHPQHHTSCLSKSWTLPS